MSCPYVIAKGALQVKPLVVEITLKRVFASNEYVCALKGGIFGQIVGCINDIEKGIRLYVFVYVWLNSIFKKMSLSSCLMDGCMYSHVCS